MAKREIYARAAVQLRTHERAVLAEKLCPGAMGLYLFLLMHARAEESYGDVSEIVALSAWGGPRTFRKKQIEALIEAGLVTRQTDRLVIVKYADHNDTPDDIAAARKCAAERKIRQRARERVTRESRESHVGVTRDINVTHAGQQRESRVSHAEVPISYSYSIYSSDRSSDPDPTGDPPSKTEDRSDQPGRLEEAQPEVAPPPTWFTDAIGTVEMQTGETLRPAEAWLRYSGHRAGKGISPNQRDAVYWLTTVMVPEARKEREQSAARREREARFAQPQPPVRKPRVLKELF